MEQYDRRAGIGTVVATMLPHTIVFMMARMILLVIWLVVGVPVGPGRPLFLESPSPLHPLLKQRWMVCSDDGHRHRHLLYIGFER